MSKGIHGKRSAARDLAIMALSVAMLAVCSYISIPIPAGHITLQLFAALLIASTLDLKKSLISVSFYVAAGLIGLPLFAGFRGGITVLFEPTGGYLIGFIIISALIPLSRKIFGNTTLCLLISSLISLIVTYFAAYGWIFVLNRFVYSGFGWAPALFIIPYIPFDALKLVVAMICAPRVRKFLYFSENSKVTS